MPGGGLPLPSILDHAWVHHGVQRIHGGAAIGTSCSRRSASIAAIPSIRFRSTTSGYAFPFRPALAPLRQPRTGGGGG